MANGVTVHSAMRASAALAAVSRACFPVTIHRAEEEPLSFIGAAIVARATGTLESIAALAPGGRYTDSVVLLRVLTEHVILLAWLAPDPESRLPLWLKDDAEKRLAMHNDWLNGAPELLPAWPRAWFEKLHNVTGKMPDTRACAKQADDYWLSRLPGVLSPARPETTFLGQYQTVFRMGSGYTHPREMGLETFMTGTPDGTVVDLEVVHARESATTMAPVMFALGLHVASASLGWPEVSAIDAAVGEFTVAVRAPGGAPI